MNVVNSSRIYRGKERCPGVTNTCHSIQLVGEIAVKAITQSSFELNVSDGTCLMCLMKFRRKSRI